MMKMMEMKKEEMMIYRVNLNNKINFNLWNKMLLLIPHKFYLIKHKHKR